MTGAVQRIQLANSQLIYGDGGQYRRMRTPIRKTPSWIDRTRRPLPSTSLSDSKRRYTVQLAPCSRPASIDEQLVVRCNVHTAGRSDRQRTVCNRSRAACIVAGVRHTTVHYRQCMGRLQSVFLRRQNVS